MKSILSVKEKDSPNDITLELLNNNTSIEIDADCIPMELSKRELFQFISKLQEMHNLMR